MCVCVLVCIYIYIYIHTCIKCAHTHKHRICTKILLFAFATRFCRLIRKFTKFCYLKPCIFDVIVSNFMIR